MCGIVGYTGQESAYGILLDCLKRLEYRGYDSAGFATMYENDGGWEMVTAKAKGEIRNLERKVGSDMPMGQTGISHTRWATHGVPSEINAHPHYSCCKRMAVVHNGIIENHDMLRDMLREKGHKFVSQTDTEVIVHLIEDFYDGNMGEEVSRRYGGRLEAAVKLTMDRLEGAYAIVVMHCEEPRKLVAARQDSPLVLGSGRRDNFVASDVSAFLKYTKYVVYLQDGHYVTVTPDRFIVRDPRGDVQRPEIHEIEWSLEDAEKGGYEHFMLKEIFEQGEAVQKTLMGNLTRIEEEPFTGAEDIERIEIVACGTSYHAGLIGKYAIEELAEIPVTVSLASEFRYSKNVGKPPMVIAITQSGETADTRGAVEEARRRGSRTMAITNVVGSSITRETDRVFYTRAGPEIGVAATKTFTTQIIMLYLIALRLAAARRTLGASEIRDYKNHLRQLPRVVEQVLDTAHHIESVARRIAGAKDVFFLGRHINFPTALEGALKLKEISYLHAEGYPSGELKHGPIALISSSTPVIAVVADDHIHDKILSNIGEVSARNAPVIIVAGENDEEAQRYTDDVLRIPAVPALLSPVPSSIVLQLLSYYTARELGRSIDKPRNLAKSVTVE